MLPTLKTLASQALVKDNINYCENKANENASFITLDKKPINIADMREDELAKSRTLRNTRGSTFQNWFENRLDQIPGKRERVQVLINADVEIFTGKKRVITLFTMEMPKMSNDDLYKFMVDTLLQHDFSILSTQTIANIGAKIMIHKPLEFRHMKVGALKLNSFFLDKQFPISNEEIIRAWLISLAPMSE